jgi:hypothetical protein
MAHEIQQRMEADGISPDAIVQGTGAERNTGQEPGGVPGNVGVVPPSAGTSNTVGTQGPPESIPYARFKEVNDRLGALRGYEELSQYGYDAESLRRLASFEQQYQSDPIGVWKSMAVNLDLPQELIAQIEAYTVNAGQAPRAAEDQTNGAARQSPFSDEDRKRLEYVDRIIERDADSARNEQLDRVLAAWDEMDARDGVATPKRTQLTYIAAMASRQQNGGPVYRTVEGLAEAARSARMEDRDFDLGTLVQSGNVNRGTPPALPGSLPTPAAPVKFTNLREASLAAEADLLAGRLSPLEP